MKRSQKNITLRELVPNITDRTCSVILMGGLGNMMFQMAALLSHAKDKGNIDPTIGYWISHQSEFSLTSSVTGNYMKNHHFEPWGGHSLKERGVSLGDVFPNLPWFDARPLAFIWDFNQDLAWKYDTGQKGEYIPIDEIAQAPFLIQGYFFNQKYWHHNREYLLRMFQPNEKINEYLNHNYAKLYSKGTISLHLRMGNDNDFIPPVVPNIEWYHNVLKSQLDDRQILVFTDNKSKSSFLLNKLDIPKSQITFIDEDPHISMIMMSRCDKHILSNSTLSFWGAYLDNKQENSDTFLHESFFQFHPESMIPYESWVIN